ncbi:hypothetical protein ACWDKQ_08905 [Saccharopolyspora sp. NPDC000995]
MARYRQRIEDIADELLDEAIERGSIDLVRDCASLVVSGSLDGPARPSGSGRCGKS